MNILDKYITREFSKLFAIMSITFIALYLIVDFFEKSRMFFSNHATVIQMVSYFVFSIPVIISLITPAAVLLATLMTFGNLTKFNEVTAMKANGISL
ncbi:MAG TPA: LptF/LptG family permease, partial [Smithellaceae bacterium]|nr:LptF/LptG family permease [Smithellaceae bacterium]